MGAFLKLTNTVESLKIFITEGSNWGANRTCSMMKYDHVVDCHDKVDKEV